ncbi:protein SREK1IP1-like isoform X2 [Watersipora subatra]|uniref:protein SREK1IP1-like isoform X2 n=1 Tax=Watersipora subatra TaxID=2589382 RepID=UPI00355C77D9
MSGFSIDGSKIKPIGCKKCGYPGHLTYECRNFIKADNQKDEILLDVSSTSSDSEDDEFFVSPLMKETMGQLEEGKKKSSKSHKSKTKRKRKHSSSDSSSEEDRKKKRKWKHKPRSSDSDSSSSDYRRDRKKKSRKSSSTSKKSKKKKRH